MSDDEYRAAPETIIVRECSTGGRILVSTICDPTINKSELGELYQQRWHVELDIRQIKEVWATLLAYNLIRLMMAQSAILAGVLPRNLSFKHCLQLWLAWRQQYQLASDITYRQLFQLMSEQRVGNRPGRTEPRAVKRRPKPHPLLTRPRHEARQYVLKFGHPKKLK